MSSATGSPIPNATAGFAEAIFEEAVGRGMLPRVPVAERIPSEAYPTPTPRPRNSVLDCTRLKAVHGIVLRPWREALAASFDRHGKAFLAEG